MDDIEDFSEAKKIENKQGNMPSLMLIGELSINLNKKSELNRLQQYANQSLSFVRELFRFQKQMPSHVTRDGHKSFSEV